MPQNLLTLNIFMLSTTCQEFQEYLFLMTREWEGVFAYDDESFFHDRHFVSNDLALVMPSNVIM